MVTKIQNTVSTENSTLVAGSAAIMPAKRLVDDTGVRRDAVEGGGTSSSNVVAETTRSTGENPFAALAAGAVRVDGSTLRLADSADATSESVEPSLEMMHLVSNLEAELATRGVWSAERIRNGMMQTTYDAQEDRVARTGVSREDSEALATKLIDRPTTGDAKAVMNAQEWHIPVSGYFKGGDVNAFVQQVLRECYLLGNLDLQMYGERVKSLNEMKKKIREEADRARKVKSDWAAQAQGDANWVSPTVYETVKVDGAQMALIPGAYADVDPTPNAGGHLQSTNGVAKAEQSAAEGFFAETAALSREAQSNLVFMRGYSSDDLREKRMADIEQYLPAMNAYDIETYLLPLLQKLAAGGHTGGILEIIEKLDPKQSVLVASLGFASYGEGNLDDLVPGEYARLVEAQRGATLKLFGEEVGKDKLGKGVSVEEAGQLVKEMKGQAKHTLAGRTNDDSSMTRYARRRDVMEPAAEQPAASAEAPATVDTVEKMEAYVKYLEEQMNSVGDDAQLANVDLQNCLQKQQQTMQMMSTISKMLHEVTMAIIRNMNS